MTDERSIPGKVREFTASDGYVLKYRHYRPAGTPRAYVVALHGIQSHSGWYESSSSRLAAAGFDVRFLDRRGSGLNTGSRGHAGDAVQLELDVLSFAQLLSEEDPGLRRPVILSSVSWGGKLAAAASTDWSKLFRQGKVRESLRLVGKTNLEDRDVLPFQGVALLYPAIFTHFDPNLARRTAIRAAHAVGRGRKRVPIPLGDPALFTDDSHWQAFIRDDPLALRRVSLSFLNASLTLTRAAKQFPDRNPPPTFIALAGRDEIVDVPRTRQWADRLPAETTRIIEYPDARHTLEFDPCRDRFVTDLIEWIESLTAKSL